jgi:hypothetical protein
MRGETKSPKDEETKRPETKVPSSGLHAPSSMLLATRYVGFTREWPDVIQGIRKGPTKAFYAPELKRLAAKAVEQAEWFHGHGLYVWTNMWLGGEAWRRRGKVVGWQASVSEKLPASRFSTQLLLTFH